MSVVQEEKSTNDDVQVLSNHILNICEKNDKRYLIGVVGIPSSGKSVFAHELTQSVNKAAHGEVCQCIGMDGFHFSRQQLDGMENPALAHQKRGAHWTFDVHAFSRLLQQISTETTVDIVAPTFDHALKDPSIVNGTVIKPSHRVVLIEGLYLFLNIAPWRELILPYFDEQWLLEVDMDLAETRIVKRHVASNICKDEKTALHRWLDNDKPNGLFLLDHLNRDALNVELSATDNGVQITNIDWTPKVTNSTDSDTNNSWYGLYCILL